MAKHYYWLKLKENFFEDDTTKFIEEQENGKDYLLLYLKLCLKSLTKDGKLYRLVGKSIIPYDFKSLATLTDTPIDTVSNAMRLFKQIGIIEVLETGELYMSQIDEMIGSETSKAQIMRDKRARDKLQISDKSNNVTKRLPEIEKEIEKELDEDIDTSNESMESLLTSFKTICTSLPCPKKLTQKRITALKARVKEYGKGTVIEVFNLTEKSDFLTNRSNTNWQATFDWVINPSNFIKILEGNYQNKIKKNKSDDMSYNMLEQAKKKEKSYEEDLPF